jgi:hypothetical protein
MSDPFRDFAERTRRMIKLTRAYERACNQAIRKLTPEKEREHPGARLVLYRKRKAAQDLLSEFEGIDFDEFENFARRHFIPTDFEGDGQ